MSTRTLTIALAVLSFVLIGFAWWVYFQSEGKLHWSVPTLCTLVPVLLVVVTVLVQRLTARHAAAGLERALAAEAVMQQRKAGSPVRSAEVDRLRSEFERAVGALKGSKLAKSRGGAREALYELPWYTIIGPPASGKTTALRNSGLKFPHLAGTGDRLKGVGGTRNCDWFLTNHAILLDTAGRWTTEEDDRDEWFAFLDLLKTHRKGHPLNGVIAAISVGGDTETSLAGNDLAGVKQLAGRMRERLDEITGRLGVALPVYVIFTKCDLISGFVEAFGEMGPEERRQIWGFTAPLLEGPSAPGPQFAEHLEELSASLERHVLGRLADEVDPAVLTKIYEFPAQFAALRDRLAAFVEELFEDSAYGETPILRGAYFTSGTQEGAPADLLIEQMAQALNVRPLQQESSDEKKSYFLHDMLVKVVFEDRTLATVSQAELLRQQTFRKRWTTGLFAAAALVPLVSAVSCQLNLGMLEDTHALVERLDEEPAPAANATAPSRVPYLFDLDDETTQYRSGMPAWYYGFGFYQGDDLEPHLTKYYGAALREWAIRPLLNRSNERLITITQQLEGLRSQGQAPSLDETTRADLNDALKLHLLLTTAFEAGCTATPLKEKEFVVPRLLALWNQAQKPRDSHEAARRNEVITRYLELLETNREFAIGGDARRVSLARQALGGEDKAGQLLAGVLQRFASTPMDLNRLVGATTALSATQPLHGAFTRESWQTAWREVGAAQAFAGRTDQWVLGCGAAQSPASSADQSQAFSREYLRRYEENWRRFLEGLSTRTPANAIEAEGILGELVGRPGVLGLLFQRVKENTELSPPSGDKPLTDQALAAVQGKLAEGGDRLGLSKLNSGSTGGGAAQAPDGPEARLARAFASFTGFGTVGPAGGDAPIEQYRRLLDPVYLALKAYRTDETKVSELAVAAQTALDSVDLLLNGHAGEFKGRLNELLRPPLLGVLDIVNSGCGAQLQRLWCESVYRPFQEELGGRYPFQVSSAVSASLSSFQRFFQPGSGVIWAFQSANLQSQVAQEGGHFRLNPGARCGVREELVHFLNRAAEVRDAFFPAGSAAVRVPFRVRVRGAAGYSVTTLRIGQKNLRYDSGAETWVTVDWPGEQAGLGATLAVTPYQGTGPRPLTIGGEWGLFMLLDDAIGHAKILERSETGFTAGWMPKGGQHYIKIDFAADDRRSPILSAPFGAKARGVLPISVPARVAQAGGGC